jgi:hypothetical protein
LLKRFLKCLPEPLLSWQLYPRFLSVARLSEPAERLRELRVLLDLLPAENRALLAHLSQLLFDIASQAAVNKMSAANLATVVGPTLLYSPLDSEASSDSLLGNMNAANLAVESIISLRAELFADPPLCTATEPVSTQLSPTNQSASDQSPLAESAPPAVKGGPNDSRELPGLNETAVSRLRTVRDQWRKRETSSSGERPLTKTQT